MTTFVYNPQRDASNAIKGFYYQVELTVVRWLQLQPDVVLYCECGEDIDHVKRLLDADDAAQPRILEQVKARNRITLRSPEALTALARFYEAVRNNPSLRILYRFSTTAHPGREQRTHFPHGLTGIEIWNRIKEGALTQSEAEKFIVIFKKLVKGSRCPQDLPGPVFAGLQAFIGSAGIHTLIDEFISRFEWAIGLPDPPQLRTEIQSLLLNQSRAHDHEEARCLADVLIVHVFHLLTQSGEKQLTVEGLEQLLLERSITELDRRILTRLVALAEQAEAYYHRLTSQAESISQGIAALQPVPEGLAQLIQQVSGIQAHLLPAQVPPPDETPVMHPGASRRTGLVRGLLGRLRDPTWLGITGATGMGKTYVASLLAEEHGLTRTAWISFRGKQTCERILQQHLDFQLLRLTSIQDYSELVTAYCVGALTFSELAGHAARRLGATGLLVLDEVPDLSRVPLLGDRLVKLTKALQQVGARLVTTAQWTLPQSIKEQLDVVVAEVQVPPMTPQDIDEILTNVAAPPALHQPGSLNLIHIATRGHPSLILAAILFLRRSAWYVDQDQLGQILTGDATGEVRAEARRKLLQLLPDDRLRELLYRLSLIGVGFDKALVSAVSEVQPAVPRPQELLPELIGPWIHQIAANRFEVSPLLSDAGQITLTDQLRRSIHNKIAFHHLRSGTIDLERAFQIVLHLLAAANWTALIDFLLRITLEIVDRSRAEAFEFLTLLFTQGQWPDNFPLPLRITFRAIQVRILTQLDRETESFIAELDTMIQEAGAGGLPMAFLAYMLIGPLNPHAPPGTAARKTLQASRIYPHLPTEFQGIPLEVPLESLVWGGVTRIQSQEAIRSVLGVLADMTEVERRAAFAYDMLRDAPELFVDRSWIVELRKPEEEQDWDGVISLLDEILGIAELPGGEPLQAPVARAKAIVFADYMDRPQDGLDVLEGALSAPDNNARFLLNYTAACILLDRSTPEAALRRYQMALAESPTAYSFLRLDALRRGAEAAGRVGDWQLVQDLSIRSLKLPAKDDQVFERLEMIGELAWAYWSLRNRRRAWGAMSGLVRGLYQSSDFENARFREVFRKAGHVLGWMASLSSTGAPPVHTSDGQPYTEPFPGFFSRSRPKMADIPLPPFFSLLFSQLGTFAAGCRLYELAGRKLDEAKRLAESEGLTALRHWTDLELAQLAARREDYSQALALGMSGIRIFPAISKVKELRVDPLTALTSLVDRWGDLPIEQRRDFERGLYWMTVGPAIARTLAKGNHADTYAAVISELETVFRQFEQHLVDSQHWLNMLRELRIAFSSLATRETIYGQIRTLPEGLAYLSPLLYLALSCAPNATLPECCGAQAVAFDYLLYCKPASELMTEDIAVFVLEYWVQIARSQAFAIRNPQAFRRKLKAILVPTYSQVAGLLLDAANSTGVRLAQDLRDRLREASLEA